MTGGKHSFRRDGSSLQSVAPAGRSAPILSVTHGTYCFHFVDLDGNAREILSNPRGGYTWIFDKGDLEGKGRMD